MNVKSEGGWAVQYMYVNICTCSCHFASSVSFKELHEFFTTESRKRKKKNWEDDDYYDSDDDTFLDRTGDIEKKRKQRMEKAGKLNNQVETYESLVKSNINDILRIYVFKKRFLLVKLSNVIELINFLKLTAGKIKQHSKRNQGN